MHKTIENRAKQSIAKWTSKRAQGHFSSDEYAYYLTIGTAFMYVCMC